MTVRSFPHLGWDPTPGDVAGTRAHGRNLSNLAMDIEAALRDLHGTDDGQWVGRSADAFRGSVHEELVPPLRSAHDSFHEAGGSMNRWAGQLADFQAETDRLERQAAAAQQELAAAARAQAGAPANADRATLNRLEDRVMQARAATDRVQDRAEELHARYRQAARSVAGSLRHAESIAPDKGIFETVLSVVVGDDAAHLITHPSEAWNTVSDWVHEHADLLKAIGDALSTLSAIAGIMAFVPPLGLVLGPLAAGLSGLAMVSHGLAMWGGVDVTWTTIAMDTVGAVAGLASVRLGTKLAKAYMAAGKGHLLTSVTTVTGKTTKVAPGLFKMGRGAARGEDLAAGTATAAKTRGVKLMVDGAGIAPMPRSLS